MIFQTLMTENVFVNWISIILPLTAKNILLCAKGNVTFNINATGIEVTVLIKHSCNNYAKNESTDHFKKKCLKRK